MPAHSHIHTQAQEHAHVRAHTQQVQPYKYTQISMTFKIEEGAVGKMAPMLEVPETKLEGLNLVPMDPHNRELTPKLLSGLHTNAYLYMKCAPYTWNTRSHTQNK